MLDLVLSAPGKNALGTDHMQRIRARLREAHGGPVLVRGEGGVFCSGLDLKEVASLGADGMRAYLALLDDVVRELYLHPGPVVACVNGHAIAGGAVLALCADHRVATSDPRARLGLNEVALGVRYPPSVLRLARARLPPKSVERVVLGAALHPPAAAASLGLVDELAEDPETVARERLAELARHPPDAYAAAKLALRRGVLDVPEEERERFERDELAVWSSPALRERIRALLGG